jgi:hypothetical protein
MAIIRWDPFRDIVTLREKMNRLFEDAATARGEEKAPFTDHSPYQDKLTGKNQGPNFSALSACDRSIFDPDAFYYPSAEGSSLGDRESPDLRSTCFQQH